MGKVILGLTISLDGFAEDKNGSVGNYNLTRIRLEERKF